MQSGSGVGGIELLRAYVARHNEGVRSGNFASLIELFTVDAEMRFEGISIGPFVGRAAIGAAFAERPPSAALYVSDILGRPAGATAQYAWSTHPARIAGRVTLTQKDGLIDRLLIEALPDYEAH